MSDECPMCGWTAGTNAGSCGECAEQEKPDLARVWRALDRLRDDYGAISTCATFATRHGSVTVLSGVAGHAMYVNGERVPIGGVR